MTTDIIHWPDAGARKGTVISSPHSAEFRWLQEILVRFPAQAW